MKRNGLRKWILAAAICVLCYEMNLPLIVTALGIYVAFKNG